MYIKQFHQQQFTQTVIQVDCKHQFSTKVYTNLVMI